MNQLLEQLERRLQKLVESTIMVFPWGQTHKSVAISLINALRLKLISFSDSNDDLPNVFTVKNQSGTFTKQLVAIQPGLKK